MEKLGIRVVRSKGKSRKLVFERIEESYLTDTYSLKLAVDQWLQGDG